MRYICTADNHTRITRPLMRIDKNFLVTVMDKWEQIVQITNNHNASLLSAGDIFHSANIPYEVFNRLYHRLKYIQNEIYFVAGQHDLKNHDPNLLYSPLYSLHNKKEHRFVLQNGIHEDVYGLQWGNHNKNIFLPKDFAKKSILLTHRCITPKKPPHFLEEAISAKKMMNEWSSFQYIITGDYHEPFVRQEGNRYLINPGSMLRMNIDQVNHKPRVYLLDTDENTVEPIYLKIKPAKKVFDFTGAKNKKDKKKFQEEMQEFIASLKLKVKDASFRKTLKSIMKKSGTNKEVKKYIKGIINEKDALL